jgi:hypothetical protein
MWTHWQLNWFFLSNPIFAICLNFQQQNPLKNQYLSHLSFENCEINSIKSESSKAFQYQQECPQFPIIFSISILFIFHWKNDSIINSFHTVSNQFGAPLLIESFLNKSMTWSTMVWEISTWHDKTKQNKTNYFAS